jgi:hypothetical protein
MEAFTKCLTRKLLRLTHNIEGTAGGAIATILGGILGWISVPTITEAIILAIIGAIVGFLTTRVLKWIEKVLKSWLKK